MKKIYVDFSDLEKQLEKLTSTISIENRQKWALQFALSELRLLKNSKISSKEDARLASNILKKAQIVLKTKMWKDLPKGLRLEICKLKQEEQV